MILTKISLPDSELNTPILQLNEEECLQWLQCHGGANVPNNQSNLSLDELRCEILEVVQRKFYHREFSDEVSRDARIKRIRVQKLGIETVQTDIWTASYHGRIREVEKYLYAQMDINITQYGYPYQTPLHAAVAGKEVQMVNFLISKGCKVLVFDANKNTPLHLGAKCGCYDIMKILLESKQISDSGSENFKKWNIPNRSNFTPTQLAIKYNHNTLVELMQSALL